MDLFLNFSLDNAAFDEAPEKEAQEILTAIGQHVVDGHVSGKIRDVNGNTIGSWQTQIGEDKGAT